MMIVRDRAFKKLELNEVTEEGPLSNRAGIFILRKRDARYVSTKTKDHGRTQ